MFRRCKASAIDCFHHSGSRALSGQLIPLYSHCGYSHSCCAGFYSITFVPSKSNPFCPVGEFDLQDEQQAKMPKQTIADKVAGGVTKHLPFDECQPLVLVLIRAGED